VRRPHDAARAADARLIRARFASVQPNTIAHTPDRVAAVGTSVTFGDPSNVERACEWHVIVGSGVRSLEMGIALLRRSYFSAPTFHAFIERTRKDTLMRIERMFHWLVPLVVAVMFASHAYADGYWARDSIWIQAPPDKDVNYQISPGQWTIDNEVMGITFGMPDKLDVPAGEKGETHEDIKLPLPPNDFFFGPDIITVGDWEPVEYWAKSYWDSNGAPPSPIPLLRLDKDQPPGKVVLIQVVQNPDGTGTLWLWKNPPFDPANPFAWDKDIADWKGPLDAALDPDFEKDVPGVGLIQGHHGTREPVIDDLSPIPTVSEWGLIILCLLLMTAGTIVIRRSMVNQEAALAT
jgi:hypothetical protein